MRTLTVLKIKDVRHICKHLGCSEKELEKFCKHPERYYHQFTLEIKGKPRPIAKPVGRLNDVLCRLKTLLSRLHLPDWIQGGVKNCSPATNAAFHISKPAVLNFDIESFFPNIKPSFVYTLFNQRLCCSHDVAHILTRLTTLNGGLPQGSPTSTVIANLVILPLASRVKRLADLHRCDYSQFVDDGAVSGPAYIEKLRPLIDKIIQQTGFRASPKPHKRTTKYQDDEQIVTGIKVNKKIDIPLPKLVKIREELQQLNIKIQSGISPSATEIASLKGSIQFAASLNPKKAHSFRIELARILKSAS